MQDFFRFLKFNFNIDESSAAQVIAALLIFLLGIVFTEIGKSLVEHRRRKLSRRIFRIHVELFEKSLSKQAKGYLTYINSLNFGGNFSMSRVAYTSDQIVKGIGYSEFFNAFFNRFSIKLLRASTYDRKLKIFNKMWSGWEAINWQEMAVDATRQHQEINNRNNELRNQELGNFLTKLDSFLIDAEAARKSGINMQDVYFNYAVNVSNVYYNWQQIPNNIDPTIIENSLVQPILEVNRSTRGLTFLTEFNKHLLNASHYYYEMLSNHERARDEFWHHYYHLRGWARILRFAKKHL